MIQVVQCSSRIWILINTQTGSRGQKWDPGSGTLDGTVIRKDANYSHTEKIKHDRQGQPN
jgi:hypothetical protein